MNRHACSKSAYLRGFGCYVLTVLGTDFVLDAAMC